MPNINTDKNTGKKNKNIKKSFNPRATYNAKETSINTKPDNISLTDISLEEIL